MENKTDSSYLRIDVHGSNNNFNSINSQSNRDIDNKTKDLIFGHLKAIDEIQSGCKYIYKKYINTHQDLFESHRYLKAKLMQLIEIMDNTINDYEIEIKRMQKEIDDLKRNILTSTLLIYVTYQICSCSLLLPNN